MVLIVVEECDLMQYWVVRFVGRRGGLNLVWGFGFGVEEGRKESS